MEAEDLLRAAMGNDDLTVQIGPTFTHSFTPEPPSRKEAEAICRSFRVPYWLLGGERRPSWFRRPIWRVRANLWARMGYYRVD